MKPGTPGFIGPRLREAREARGMTITYLAEQLGVTKSAVSQYEKGVQTPRPEVMAAISSVLQLETAFFSRPAHKVDAGTIFFRSLSSTTKAARLKATTRFGWLHELVSYLRNFVEFPQLNFPSFGLSSDPTKLTNTDIENIATETRRFWGMGDAPISNVVWLLENNGAIVVRDDLGADTLDALSTVTSSEDRPYIVLGTGKGVAARSRFDACHELGHIVLHRDVKTSQFCLPEQFKFIEGQAHRFAGAFLLPKKAFVENFYAAKLDLFRVLKEKWKVSIAMMIMRADHLGLLSDEHKQRLWINYSRRGWRVGEPLDDQLEVEQPRLLRRSLELLLGERIVSRDAILEHVSLSARDIEQLASLPTGILSEGGPVVRLRESGHRTRSIGESGRTWGEVVPFPRGGSNMSKGNVHVTRHPDGGWQVKRAGAERSGSLHDTQRDAIEKGRTTAQREGVELVIHGKDGKIRDKDSFGNDPCPPRDEKH